MTQAALLDLMETELRQVLEKFRNDIATLDEAALKFRPAEGEWNILECLAHLNAYSDLYIPRIQSAIHKAKARKWTPEGDVKYAWGAKRAVKRVDAENGKFYKAKKNFNFIGQNLDKGALKIFVINTEKVLRNIQFAREIDLNKPTFQRAKSRFFSFTLGNSFEWLVAHSKRHLLQMEAVTARMQAMQLV
jgi:DinB superfamily